MFRFGRKLFLTPFIRGGIFKNLSLQEDDEYEEGKSLIDANDEEENESDEQILISKHFHLVSLNENLYTKAQKNLVYINSAFIVATFFCNTSC